MNAASDVAIFELDRGRVARPQRGGRSASRQARGLYERSAPGAAVICKITSHAKSPRTRRQRIKYLAHGCDHLENERGSRLTVAEAAKESRNWCPPQRSYGPHSGRHARYSAQVTISFPAGTDPKVVEFVARNFAKENFAGHEYCWGVHANHGQHPHAHFVVATPSPRGALKTDREQIQRWREDVAERSRSVGLRMQAHAHHYRLQAERHLTGPVERMAVRTGQLVCKRAERLLASIRRVPEAHRDIAAKRHAELCEDARTLVATEDRELVAQAAGMVAREINRPQLPGYSAEQRGGVFRTAAAVARACPDRHGPLSEAVARLAKVHATEWRKSRSEVEPTVPTEPSPEIRAQAKALLTSLRRQNPTGGSAAEPGGATPVASETSTESPSSMPTASKWMADHAAAAETTAKPNRRAQARRLLTALRRNPEAVRALQAKRTDTLIGKVRDELTAGGDRTEAVQRATRQLIHGLTGPTLMPRSAEERAKLVELIRDVRHHLQWRNPADTQAIARLRVSQTAVQQGLSTRHAEAMELATRGPVGRAYAAIGGTVRSQAQTIFTQLRIDPDAMRARQAMRTQTQLIRLRRAMESRLALTEAGQTFVRETMRPKLYAYTRREQEQLRLAAGRLAEKLPDGRLRASLAHAREVWSKPDERSVFGSASRRTQGVAKTALRQQAQRVLHGLRVGPDSFRIREVQRTAALVSATRETFETSKDPDAARQASDQLVAGLRKMRLFPLTKDQQTEISALAERIHTALPARDERRRAALRIAATNLADKRHLLAEQPKRPTSIIRVPLAKPAALMRSYARAQVRNLLACIKADPDAFRARESVRTRQYLRDIRERVNDGEPAKAAALLLRSLRRPRLFPPEQDDRRLLVNTARDILERLPEQAKATRRHLRWEEQKLSHRLPASTLEHATRIEAKDRDRARARGEKPAPQRATPTARTMVKAYYREQAKRLLHVLRVHPDRLRARYFARTHRFIATLNAELVGTSSSRMNMKDITPQSATRATKQFLRGANRPRLMPPSAPERYLLLGLAATLQDHLPDTERRLTNKLTATAATLSAIQRTETQALPRPQPPRPGPRWREDIDLTR